ncbi:ribonuclease HII [Atopobium fossor]|uniref:ribonuclease HII n=1 Tax=Atopobium fossor TaxID=39487 RepID=UPI000403D4F0|nr:ribonuclease HII [Atopobium fossor]
MTEYGQTRPGTAREICALLSDASFDEIPVLAQRYSEDPRTQVKHAVAVALRRHEKEVLEHMRVSVMYQKMQEYGGDGIVLGIDEVGRGAVAGPLTVCAVALPPEPVIWGINDSKQLTPARREALASQITRHALAIGVAHIEPDSIDAIGMGTALRMAMVHAITDAGIEPDAVLIDGNPVHIHPKEHCVVKGDATIACIAAASIVAKTTRDAIMVAYDAEYPGYHFAESKGYASAEHIAAIKARGLCPIHRVSFCNNFLETPPLF